MSQNASNDNQALLAQATRGDRPALDQLLIQYLPRVQAFVRLRMDGALRARMGTEDLVQSVCVDLLRNQHDFEYRSDPEFRAWLFNAALHKLKEKQRFHGRQRRDVRREVQARTPGSGVATLQDVYKTVGTPSQDLAAKEHIENIEAAFEGLPDHYREVITLARIADLPHHEIAQAMGKTVGAVRQMLGRALVTLADLLAKDASGP